MNSISGDNDDTSLSPDLSKRDNSTIANLRPRMCAYLRMPGGCRLRQHCAYCHSLDELQSHPRYKARPCMQFISKGTCDAGTECSFYHYESEKRQLPQEPQSSSNGSIPSASSASGASAALSEHRPVIPEMCKYYLRGSCSKGNQCKFAHGANERMSIYKTKPCDHYWLHGVCERGESCGFYHDVSERRQPQSSQPSSSQLSASFAENEVERESVTSSMSDSNGPSSCTSDNMSSAVERADALSASSPTWQSYIAQRLANQLQCHKALDQAASASLHSGQLHNHQHVPPTPPLYRSTAATSPFLNQYAQPNQKPLMASFDTPTICGATEKDLPSTFVGHQLF